MSDALRSPTVPHGYVLPRAGTVPITSKDPSSWVFPKSSGKFEQESKDISGPRSESSLIEVQPPEPALSLSHHHHKHTPRPDPKPMELFRLPRSTTWVLMMLPLTLARHHQPANLDDGSQGWSDAKWTRIYVGIIVGILGLPVLLALLCIVAYIWGCILYEIEQSKLKRAERARADGERAAADEEFATTPLAAPPPTASLAPPP